MEREYPATPMVYPELAHNSQVVEDLSVLPAEPLVTIRCITFNHARYIREALEGFLRQRTNFPVEILIGDDASTDGTREILRQYQAQHPELIRAVYQTENQYSKGLRPWRTLLYKMARGKYLAYCEGDDFWTDPLKLQKQVDFLEAHPGYALCFHDANILREQEQRMDPLRPAVLKPSYTLTDLLHGNFIPMLTVMFRRGLFGDFPAWYYEMPIGDWPLHILNAMHGEIGYLPEVMAVYRLHPGGLWSSMDEPTQRRNEILVYRKLIANLAPEHRQPLKAGLSRLYHRMALESERSGKKAEASKQLWQSFVAAPRNPLVSTEERRELFKKLWF